MLIYRVIFNDIDKVQAYCSDQKSSLKHKTGGKISLSLVHFDKFFHYSFKNAKDSFSYNVQKHETRKDESYKILIICILLFKEKIRQATIFKIYLNHERSSS